MRVVVFEVETRLAPVIEMRRLGEAVPGPLEGVISSLVQGHRRLQLEDLVRWTLLAMGGRQLQAPAQLQHQVPHRYCQLGRRCGVAGWVVRALRVQVTTTMMMMTEVILHVGLIAVRAVPVAVVLAETARAALEAVDREEVAQVEALAVVLELPLAVALLREGQTTRSGCC